MANLLASMWVAWCAGALLLALGLIVLNARRRRRISRSGDEATRDALPTWREDLFWGGLILMGSILGTAVNLFLLKDGHTARALLVSAIFGMMMLLGVLMLLKNGLAPTDVLRLDVQESAETPAPQGEGRDRLPYRGARSLF